MEGCLWHVRLTGGRMNTKTMSRQDRHCCFGPSCKPMSVRLDPSNSTREAEEDQDASPRIQRMFTAPAGGCPWVGGGEGGLNHGNPLAPAGESGGAGGGEGGVVFK